MKLKILKSQKTGGKLLNWLIIVTVFVFYFSCIALICRTVPIDSDKANHLLQAQDILSGNILLRDWNLTGVTFFTTDLVYYEIAYLFFGLSNRAIHIAGALMISSAIIMGLCLCTSGMSIDEQKKSIIIYILLCAIPCWQLTFMFRVHTGAVFVSFLLYYVGNCILAKEDDNKAMLPIFFLITIIGAFGDMLAIIEGTFPCIVVALWRYVNSCKEGVAKNKKYVEIVVVSIFGVVTAKALDLLFFWVGKANRNSFMNQLYFSDSDIWSVKLQSLWNELSSLSFADFDGHFVFDIWNYPKILSFIILVLSLILLVRIVGLLVKNDIVDIDNISLMLVIGIILSLACYLFTNRSESRYITIVPISLFILFIRNRQWFVGAYSKKMQLHILLILACFGIFVGKIHDVTSHEYPESTSNNYKLIEFLEEHELTNGYASFWNSSNITVLSKGNVKIRHIQRKDDSYQMYNWFNKNCWYKEKTNFILINKVEDLGPDYAFGVNEQDVSAILGIAKERYEVCGYIILVFDRDISADLAN